MSANTLCERVNNYRQLQIKKRGCLHLPVHRSWPSTAFAEKQTEKHPRWSIWTPVKCALRIPDPRSTLRRVYTTPRGVTQHCFRLLFDCGSSNIQKQSVSNAFYNVVLRPSAPSSSDDITAPRADSICKDTNLFHYLIVMRCFLNLF